MQDAHVAHNSLDNIGKLRSDCWQTVRNVRFANRDPFVNNCLWLGFRVFIVRIPTYYLPKMGQQNYFLLAQPCFKIVGPTLARYWHANPKFPTVSKIYQRWLNYLCYLGKQRFRNSKIKFLFISRVISSNIKMLLISYIENFIH